jgi:hypothetical protein
MEEENKTIENEINAEQMVASTNEIVTPEVMPAPSNMDITPEVMPAIPEENIEPVMMNQSVVEEPVQEQTPSTVEPIVVETPVEKPVQEQTPSKAEPVVIDTPIEQPVQEQTPSTAEPIVVETPVEQPVQEQPLEISTPVVETPVEQPTMPPEEKTLTTVPVEEQPATPAPVESSPLENNKPEEPKKKSKLPLILILIIVLAAGGFAVWYFVLGGNGSKKEQKEEPKQEEKKEEKETEVTDNETKEKIEFLINKMFDTSMSDPKRNALMLELKQGKKGLTTPEKIYLTFYINGIKYEDVTNKDEVIEVYKYYVDGGYVKKVKMDIVHEGYKKLFNEEYSPKDIQEQQEDFIEGLDCPSYLYTNETKKEYYFLTTCGNGTVGGSAGKYSSSIEKITKKNKNYYGYVKLVYSEEGKDDEITNIKFVFDNNFVFVETITG